MIYITKINYGSTLTTVPTFTFSYSAVTSWFRIRSVLLCMKFQSSQVSKVVFVFLSQDALFEYLWWNTSQKLLKMWLQLEKGFFLSKRHYFWLSKYLPSPCTWREAFCDFSFSIVQGLIAGDIRDDFQSGLSLGLSDDEINQVWAEAIA